MYINDLQRKLKKAHLEMHTLAREEEHLIDQIYRLNKTEGGWEAYDDQERWDMLVELKTRISEIHEQIDTILDDIHAEHPESYEEETDDTANEEVFHDGLILEIHFHHAPAQNTTRDRDYHR